MGKKILIIDDSHTVRRQVCLILGKAGYEVVEAADGIDGIEAIRAMNDIAMVICDVHLPRMSGIDMLEVLHKSRQMSDLCVLMLTTESHAGQIARARLAGAKAWIVKPFEADVLLAAVRQFTRWPVV